ncbi:ATP-binding cassette domain-containing protein [Actinomadura alba]|uniref:ATP-binding cassette domain-containing protein n=1 Tax=Actinomadura alba TaxID=406431 RepID=A0ABR7LXH4_9ACTN|nr:ATP-binding cassette domain-containing protein [Actinomadura alba]MBC6469479.1 ATP-binding cassette domain-containing protein [Actinomadura alba]
MGEATVDEAIVDGVPAARPRCSITARIRGGAATVLDARSSRRAPAVTRCLVVCVALASATAACVIAQAALLAHALSSLTVPAGLAAVVAGRAVLAWAGESALRRTSAGVASRLRGRLLAQAVRNGPSPPAGEPAALLARADSLTPYFTRCLPRLAAAVVVPSVALAAMAVADPPTAGAALAAAAVLVLPALLLLRPGRFAGGRAADRAAQRRRTADGLAGHFTDMVAGLPTLTVFGRARAQGWNIARATEQYRLAANGAARPAFRSELVLEAVATLSVALVVTTAGLRVASGALSPESALFLLFLAVEGGLPLYGLAGHVRAGRESLAAAGGILDFLETPARPAERASARSRRRDGGDPADVRSMTIRVEDVVVAPGTASRREAVPLTMTLAPETTTALTGPPGTGKSGLIAALLGFETPIAGRIMVGDRRLEGGDGWRSGIAWVPQRPALFAGTVADNIAIAAPGAHGDAVAEAAAAAGVGSSIHLDARLGPGGAGLPAAGRRRIALARAVLRCALLDPPLLLLDEPTADLDVLTEIELAEAVGALLPGRTALIVTRRQALLGRADHVVSLAGAGAVTMAVPA